MAETTVAQLPAVNRTIELPSVTYTCPITRDTWSRPAYRFVLSENLVPVPDKNQYQALELVPQGNRMSGPDLFQYIAHLNEKLRNGELTREKILNDPIFARQIKGDPYNWEHSHIVLRPHKGLRQTRPSSFMETSNDYFGRPYAHNGRPYSIADMFLVDKSPEGRIERPHAEGIALLHGKGLIVVGMNPVTGIYDALSDGDENHIMHAWFEPDKNEVAVCLGGYWYDGELDGCLYLGARVGRSFSGSGASFRLVQGSLGDLPIPNYEAYVKDPESYERGIVDGQRQAVELFARELVELSERVKHK